MGYQAPPPEFPILLSLDWGLRNCLSNRLPGDVAAEHTLIQGTYPENHCSMLWASLVAQMVKTLPTTQETWVQPLGGEDSLEKRMATHSRILA